MAGFTEFVHGPRVCTEDCQPSCVFLGIRSLIPAVGKICLRNNCFPLSLKVTKRLCSVGRLLSIFRVLYGINWVFSNCDKPVF